MLAALGRRLPAALATASPVPLSAATVDPAAVLAPSTDPASVPSATDATAGAAAAARSRRTGSPKPPAHRSMSTLVSSCGGTPHNRGRCQAWGDTSKGGGAAAQHTKSPSSLSEYPGSSSLPNSSSLLFRALTLRQLTHISMVKSVPPNCTLDTTPLPRQEPGATRCKRPSRGKPPH